MTANNSRYIEQNRKLWNARTAFHVASGFYDVDGFLGGKNSLNDIELRLLGDIHTKKVLHLQCHFGQDTLSMARMGAMVTGVDLSDKAIEEARKLSSKSGLAGNFICCDIYDLPKHLNEQFDIVFTSYGTIGWLPDLDKWAAVIAHFLKPGGQFIFAEFHPVVWMFDNDFKNLAYPYFKSDAIIEMENNTYADKDAAINLESVTWNHSIAEVLTALLNQKLQIENFEEYNYSPYNCFSNMVESSPGKFQIASLGNKIPMVYAFSMKIV